MAKIMDRRAALGRIAALASAALPAPAIAALPSEPDAALFALLAQCKFWWNQIGDLSRLCDEVAAEKEGREVKPEDEERRDEAMSRYQEAFDATMSTPPQTVAGILAMLEWIEVDCGGLALSADHVHMMAESFRASPILAVGA